MHVHMGPCICIQPCIALLRMPFLLHGCTLCKVGTLTHLFPLSLLCVCTWPPRTCT